MTTETRKRTACSSTQSHPSLANRATHSSRRRARKQVRLPTQGLGAPWCRLLSLEFPHEKDILPEKLKTAMTAMTRKTPAEKVEDKLQALQSFDFGKDAAADVSTLQAALGDSNSRVVAKAAQIAEQRLCYAVMPAMIAAFARFEVDGVKRDPRCFAKQAIARALVALDCDD